MIIKPISPGIEQSDTVEPLFLSYNLVVVTLSEPLVTVIVILAGLGGDLVLGHPQSAHHVYLHQAPDTLGELINNLVFNSSVTSS